jgi:hypothetical protein
MLANANRKLNIVDRMTIISSVNEYFLTTENRINELEKQVKKLNNDFEVYEKISCKTTKKHE